MQALAEQLSSQAINELRVANDLKLLDAIRVNYLGKKGSFTHLLKDLKNLNPDERPAMGQKLNVIKQALESAFVSRKQQLELAEMGQALKSEAIDVTLPGRGISPGHLHPLSQTMAWIEDWFTRFGFEVATGPDIEHDFYNFEALNIPKNHPARAMHDTFYLTSGEVLRTHTSPVQIRIMESQTPPLRIIAPGRVYRCDNDATHTPQFHQLEGFVIDESIHMGHLKALLNQFLRAFFDDSIEIRWRPSYFPFTEPSTEIDIKRRGGDWLEILGAGMVHPKVLSHAGLDPERYTGFAFGMGLERLTMLRYNIEDLRWFFDGDLRFISQF